MKELIHMKKFLIALVRDLIDQIWTLVALVISWIVLEGSAKITTLKLIIVSTTIWILSFPFRYDKED